MFDHAAPSGLSASSYVLSDGKAGILQTARVMREMVAAYKVDPNIRVLALSLVSFLTQKDHAGEVECLFCYVRDQIRYVQDIYQVETLATPDKTLETGQGDCDDKSTLLACLLETIGFQTAFRLAGYHSREFEHVYVVTWLPDGTEIALDATEPEPMGYEPPCPTALLDVQ